MIGAVFLIWCVFDAPQLFRPINVVRPIVRPVIDEIRDRIVDPVTGREVNGKTVIVVSRDWCKYCKDLIRDEMPKAKKAGYAVIVDDKTEAAGYPLTRIWDGKKWTQRSGFFKWEKRNAKPTQRQVGDYIRKNNGSAPPASWYPNGDPWRNLTAKEANEMFEGQGE